MQQTNLRMILGDLAIPTLGSATTNQLTQANKPDTFELRGMTGIPSLTRKEGLSQSYRQGTN
jgi:hypothetical protein